MKKVSIALLLLCVACGRESRDESARNETLPVNPPVPRTATHAPSTAVAVAPPTLGKSTPSRCAGDGSYEQALDCFRISSGFHFVMNGSEGDMTRTTPGMERVQFKTADGTTWIGEAKPSGVVWNRNGSHQAAPPDLTNQVWQRTTMVLDPQKKEGAAQLAGTETVRGEACKHYHFTNANSGVANDVWVSTNDGRIVKWSAGKSTLELR
jgi:hypothetical protein